AYCQRRGVTLYAALLAAFHVLLHRYSGQDVIAVGSPAAGRSTPEFEGLVGLFTNPTVVLSDFSSAPSFDEAVAQVREKVLEGLRHQDLPFATLVDGVGASREPGRSPLFDVMFLLHRAQRAEGLADLLAPDAPLRRISAGPLTFESFAFSQ